jgi:type IV pilus assembly protein PilA
MNRKGFTLIELLIVVVIIGILAAIAIPKFANTKEKAYIASMKSDLRNLVTAEEAFFADSLKYADLAELGTNYSATTGVTISALNVVVGEGWNATATYPASTTATCEIFVGSAAAGAGLTYATKEGEPKCGKP